MITFEGKHPIKYEVIQSLLEEIDFDQQGFEYTVQAEKIEEGLEVNFENNAITLGYACEATYCRALALMTEALINKEYKTIKQVPKFDALGMMIDCSRNAVLKVGTVKRLMRYLALMGYKSLQLYTEDTYELEGYPYFGYMRGSYTVTEIEEVVAYGETLGMEVIPCIQTLAHLAATLRWKTYDEITDCDNILLVGEEKTYAFIEAMIKHAATHFKSRRINIGMDEAHNLGLGKYLQKHGYKERIGIMVEHLTKVVELCRKHGMKPMMWSDMFFRLLSATGDYDVDCDLGDNEVLELLPKDVDIIYWDYYNKEKSHYDSIIKQHQKLDNTTIFAGGAWRWRGVVPDNTFSLYVSEQGLKSSIEHGIKEVFITAWGDDGGECASFATLPNLVYYAERCYEEVVDETLLKKRFKTFTGANWDDFLALDGANHLPDNPAPGRCSVNPSKYLFFQDVLLGIFDRHVVLGETNAFYEKLAKDLEEARVRNPKWAYIFTPIYLNAKILSNKAEIGVRLQNAYKAKDKEAMKQCIQQLEVILEDVKAYHQAFRAQWRTENKMSGLEVQDQRMGGMYARIENSLWYLQEYVDGHIDCIEELEYDRLRFDCRKDEEHPLSIASAWWFEMVTPNRIGRT
ncbi:MAG: beta-N-acetylhexosaminidase [Cellulosilyticaceae bacterium]